MATRTRCTKMAVVWGAMVALMLLFTGATYASHDAPTVQVSQTALISQQTELNATLAATLLEQPPLCRYGVTASGAAQLSWLPTWRTGWWMNYNAQPPIPGVAAEFAQVILTYQQKNGCTYQDGYTTYPPLTEDGLGAAIRAAPGSLWMVGNEPDRGPNPENCLESVQGDTFPEVYARIYHDVYAYIKQRDPTAQVANAGLVQVTPGRLQYLDKVWQAYQQRYGHTMPVDVWNIHLYILPETQPDGQPNGIANIALGTDPALAIRESGGDASKCSDPKVYCYAEHDDLSIFAEQVTAMRTWMKAHGQQSKPLIISEYSILYPNEIDPGGCYLQDEYGNCFTSQRVNTFMSRTFDYLETATNQALGYPLDNNRLVQRWMWFSAYSSRVGNVSNLLVNTFDALTPVGAHFRDEVSVRLSTRNLLPGRVGGSAGHAGTQGGTANASLYAEVLNNGSVATDTPVSVIFYADQALTQVIGSATAPAALPGCASHPAWVRTTWPNLSVGVHPFWVKVDNGDGVAETNEADNVGAGSVTVYTNGVFLPTVWRQ